MSLLSEDFIEETDLRIENQQLKKELQHQRIMLDWYDEMIFEDRLFGEYHAKSRSKKMSEMYELIYGDTPLCDTCDGRTGFFLEIDRLYDAINSNKWLLRILRWGHFYKS